MRSLVLLFVVCALSPVSSASAALVFNFSQVGANVVVNASGSANTAGLSLPTNDTQATSISAGLGFALVGNTGNNIPVAAYTTLTGPAVSPFSGFTVSLPTSGSGDNFGVRNLFNQLYLPRNYVSGSALSATNTFTNTTLAGLGLTTGTYIWRWGSGANADSLTMNIGVTAVPEPSSIALLGLCACGLTARRVWKKGVRSPFPT